MRRQSIQTSKTSKYTTSDTTHKFKIYTIIYSVKLSWKIDWFTHCILGPVWLRLMRSVIVSSTYSSNRNMKSMLISLSNKNNKFLITSHKSTKSTNMELNWTTLLYKSMQHGNPRFKKDFKSYLTSKTKTKSCKIRTPRNSFSNSLMTLHNSKML